MSSDSNPSNAVRIARVPYYTNSHQWTKYPEQQSSLISLTAGQKYYIEVLHKEGSGSDNVAVAWEGPGLGQQVIDGMYLSIWTGDEWNYGDFTGNDIVNIDDLSEFSEIWLERDCNNKELDLNRDCIINLYEFSLLARNWLEEVH